jgi:hypothetical protein
VKLKGVLAVLFVWATMGAIVLWPYVMLGVFVAAMALLFSAMIYSAATDD